MAGCYAEPLLLTSYDERGKKAQQTLKDAELIKQFQKIVLMPDDEKNTVVKVIAALLRDFNARQTYAFKLFYIILRYIQVI